MSNILHPNITSLIEIAPINAAHHVVLVQDTNTGKIYIKKALSVYNLSIYQKIQSSQIQGIPHIYCLQESNNELTIIEEYISGDTLSELIDQYGAFDENTTAKIIIGLCDILTKLHQFTPPIIHRDIKPSNVIITPSNQVYLLDLNAARSSNIKEEDTVLLGTKGYAAPEQYGFGSSNIQTDIYATGMLINTMLTGEFSHTIVDSHRFYPIIKKCTELNPKDRYNSFIELKNDLIGINPKEDKVNLSWRDFLPPGFRSNTVWHMLIAVPAYLLIFYMSLSLTVENTYGAELWCNRICFLLILLSFVACGTNYLNIQKYIPLCSKKDSVIRLIGIILLSIVLGSICLILLQIIESIFF